MPVPRRFTRADSTINRLEWLRNIGLPFDHPAARNPLDPDEISISTYSQDDPDMATVTTGYESHSGLVMDCPIRQSLIRSGDEPAPSLAVCKTPAGTLSARRDTLVGTVGVAKVIAMQWAVPITLDAPRPVSVCTTVRSRLTTRVSRGL